MNITVPAELLTAIREKRHTPSEAHSAMTVVLENHTGTVLRVEGEDKAGLRDALKELEAKDAASVRFSASRYSSLVLALSSPYGNYLPLRVPLPSVILERPAQEQVNMMIEMDGELEA